MAYTFPHESEIEVFVTERLEIAIKEEDDCYGNGQQVIIFSQARLPMLIACLCAIKNDLDAGKYDAEDDVNEA